MTKPQDTTATETTIAKFSGPAESYAPTQPYIEGYYTQAYVEGLEGVIADEIEAHRATARAAEATIAELREALAARDATILALMPPSHAID